MAEFLQNYGVWIIFGLLLSLMLWGHVHGHGHGGGCSMGGHQHDQEESEKKEGQQESGKRSSSCH